MRRWLCCTCQVEESYHSNENGLMKSHSANADGHQKDKVPPPVKFDAQKPVPTIEVPGLSLDELKEKTENFRSKALIGEGSYGRVYFANLNNGKSVAVKKLDVSTEAESDNEFLTQISQCFWNYCVEGNTRVLAYEFATMGSLYDILHGTRTFVFYFDFHV
ncbi:putative non-specific protein-tyrosine kinase [Helianthus annuus]|nr:putative non-specific protein-tyrosine kinase [Helianthus annuus]